MPMTPRLSSPTISFAAALLVLAGLGLWHIQTSPALWLDEGVATGVAMSLAREGIYGIQVAPQQFVTEPYWLTIHYPVVLPIAAVFRVFGVSILAARLVMFAYLLGTVCAAFLLVRTLSNGRIAAWSAWLLVTFSPFYGNGKAVLGETPGIFWMLIGTWCWIRATAAHERSHPGWWLAAGASFGLCATAKPFYLLLLPAAGIVYVLSLIKEKRFRFTEAAAFAAPIVFTGGAWLFQILPKPISGDSFLTVLRFFGNSYAIPITTSQMLGNVLRFVTESTPIHLAILLAVLLLFLFRMRPRPWHPALVTLGIFMTVSLIWYIKTPGWYRYFYSVHLLALVFAPLALWKLETTRLTPFIKRVVLCALILVQAAVTLRNQDNHRSDALLSLPAAIETYVPGRALFLAHVPEAALVLPPERLSQTIEMNPTLSIGVNPLLTGGPFPEVVITSTPEQVGVGAIEPVLEQRYRLRWRENHYRIFERVDPRPGS